MNVVVYTRQSCPLCEEGIAIAGAVFGTANIELVDIDLDLTLLETYTDRVPVIETVAGEVIAEGVITERALSSYVRTRT